MSRIGLTLPPHTGVSFTKTIHHDTYPFIDPLKSSGFHKSHSVFITGASKGIGRQTAISFAQSGASKIAIGARSSLDSVESEILDAASKAGHPAPQVMKIQLDVLDKESVKRAAQQVDKAFGEGGLDILVNNAAWLETFKPMGDADVDDWWYTWEMNVRGVFLMTHAFLPLLLKSKEKTILNLTSIGAHLTAPGASAYQSSKLAVIRLTEFMMVDYGAQGLLVYTIHPGGVPTDMGLRMPEEAHVVLIDTAALSGDSIAFLTRDRRQWLAGRYISCTWDMEELLEMKDEIVAGDKLKVRMVV
ncbi:NAD-P-binding protein [Stereum hirsutum FP-91666 SS1]|uniref:NAD-P-binding protein n=1 Tax=Stereum hirsutum (strain FP-91666) TaxID=721885 RepID=UPI000440C950|nr:NAD-P-binding protein [Stereum hirsutum FP-91666 SS1]EIM87434.1 NAD-P-binding protein [Stereum hirsutum FP-91666 SS1]